jgi:hypothetical protein
MESNPFGSFGFKGIVVTRQVRTDLGPRQTYPSRVSRFVTQFKKRGNRPFLSTSAGRSATQSSPSYKGRDNLTLHNSHYKKI